MSEFLNNFFTTQFIPHGHCYLWKPGLVWLHLVSDGLIALAYYAIPVMLVYFVRNRRDVPFDWMFLMFGLFIISCGTTHVMEIWTLWHPTYWLSGALKAITALASVGTAVLLVPLIPLALALPSPAQLEAINRELKQEIEERQQLEEERQKLTTQMQQQARLLEAILSASPDLIYMYDQDGRYLYASLSATKALGLQSTDMLGKTWQELGLPSDQMVQFDSQRGAVFETGQLVTDEVNFPTVDGTRNYEYILSPVRNGDGNVEAVVATARDITERKQAEATLREQAQLLDLAHDTILVRRTDGIITFWNHGAEEMYGWTKEEALGKNSHTLLQIEFPQPLEVIEAALLREGRWEGELVHTRRDGTRAVVASRWALQRDELGNKKAVLEINNDISDRRRMEEALQKEQEFLRVLLDNVQAGIVACDAQGAITLFNQIAREFHGLPEQPLPADQWAAHYDLYLPDGKTLMKKEDIPLFRAWVGERVSNVEMAIVPKHGKARTVSASGQAIFDAQGKKLGAVGVMHDITERKQAEQALAQARDELEIRVKERTADLTKINKSLQAEIIERHRVEEELRETMQRYRFLADAMPQMVWTAQPDGHMDYFNQRWFEYTGFTQEETFAAQGWMAVLHPDDLDLSVNRWYEAVRTGETYEIEYRFNRADGQYRWHLGRALPMRDEQGRIVKWFGTCTDIDEVKRVELQIKASLQEKEVLLKEIHHRVKNNLQIISSLLNLQAESLQDNQAQEIFKVSQSRIESMALIHEKLYQSQDLALINFAEYIQDLVASLFSSYEVNQAAIDLQINIDEVLVCLDTAIPCSLIINELVLNSLKHAFPPGQSGEICILGLHSKRDNQFTLTVRDNGIGLPKDFDFRNTDSLGLQLVNVLTNQLKGTVGIDTSRGVEFKIIFPLGK